MKKVVVKLTEKLVTLGKNKVVLMVPSSSIKLHDR